MQSGGDLEGRGGGVLSEVALIVITALVTSGLSTVFSYYKEKKFASIKYTEKVFVELYLPLYKFLQEAEIDPMVGYIGLSESNFWRFKEIIDEKPELIDPKLDAHVNKIIEEIHVENSQERKQKDYFYGYKFYDESFGLYFYVVKSFNITRKSLGLPYDKHYASLWSFAYRFIRRIKRKRRNKKLIKNLVVKNI